MNKPIVALLTAATALAAGGCATTTAPEPVEGRTSLVSAPLDTAYIAVVDHIARQRGVRVIWVNAPRRAGDRVRLSYPAINPKPVDEGDGETR